MAKPELSSMSAQSLADLAFAGIKAPISPSLGGDRLFGGVKGPWASGVSNLGMGRPVDIQGQEFENIEEMIKAQFPIAEDIVRQGAKAQREYAAQAMAQGLSPLQRAQDMRAFEEQQRLLGARGAEAQEQAIGDIPVSEFDRELEARQRKRLMRQAAVSGEAGGGATLQAGAQLAGAQQANRIQQRLAQLEPLAALSRTLAGQAAQEYQQGMANQAQAVSGLGTQLANLRMGAAAPAVQSRMHQAKASGLQRIASANQRAQQMQQLVGLGGIIAGSF